VKGTLELINHAEHAVCAQIIRLFFGNCSQMGDVLFFPLSSEQIARSPAGVSISVRTDVVIDSDELTGLRHVQAFSSAQLESMVSIEIVLRADRLHRFSCQTKLPDFRRNLKRVLYLALSNWTGISFPWGSLTGVRPTQICAELLERCGREEAIGALRADWGLSEEKAKLGVEVGAAEQEIISRYDADKDYVVYCGLPFCPTRCSYCSFTTRDAARYADKLELYVDTMLEEAGQFFDGWHNKAAAIYFGGGTPTSLPADLFARYIKGLLELIPHDTDTELTMEAGRPDTLDKENLNLIKDAGFGRLCINPQTMHDASLCAIGRNHTVADTITAFELARETSDFVINMDLIYGLPGEAAGDFLASLDAVMYLGPENITLHSLALKQSARLMEEMSEHDLKTYLGEILPDIGLERELTEGYKRLRHNEYLPYYLYKQKRSRGALENTGFSKLGCESIYNVLMMSDRFTVIGLGSGATSKFIGPSGVVRQHNSKDLADYINRVSEFVNRKIELQSI